MARLDKDDEQDSKDKPPKIVRELAADLLADKVYAAAILATLPRSLNADTVEGHCTFHGVSNDRTGLPTTEELAFVGLSCRWNNEGVLGAGVGVCELNGSVSLSRCRQSLVVAVDAERALFVDIGCAHGDDDWVDGNIHHDEVDDLHGNVQVGKWEDDEACGSDR